MPEQDEEDVARYYGDAPAVTMPPLIYGTGEAPAIPVNANVAPGYSEQFGSPAPVIKAAVAQLNAGQPVTALPRVSFSYDQQQAWLARMDEFDRQAKAARMAADQAARDAQLLDQMSRVAKSTKDIEVALRAQDEIGFRNAVAGGTPPLQAFQRYPRAASAPLVSAVRDAQQPSWVAATGNAPGHFVTRAGGVAFPPVSMSEHPDMPTVAQPVTTPEGEVLGYGAATGPTTRRIIPKVKAGTLDASTRKEIDLLAREKSNLDKEMSTPAWEIKASLPEFKKEVDAAKSRRDFIDRRLSELMPTAFPSKATNAPVRSAVRNPKTGKWELK